MEYFSKHPLPPFMPRGKIVHDGKWDDEGEWDDDAPAFPNSEEPPSP